MHGQERGHLDTLFTHPFKELMTHIPTAYVVVDKPYLHPLLCLGDQGIGYQLAQGILGKDIHIYMDMTLCLVDSSQQGREELIAVGVYLNLVILEG